MSSQKQSHRYIRLVEDVDETRELIAQLWDKVDKLESKIDHPKWKFWKRKKEATNDQT